MSGNVFREPALRLYPRVIFTARLLWLLHVWWLIMATDVLIAVSAHQQKTTRNTALVEKLGLLLVEARENTKHRELWAISGRWC